VFSFVLCINTADDDDDDDDDDDGLSLSSLSFIT